MSLVRKLLVFTPLIVLAALAQSSFAGITGQISGTALNEETKEPLVGVTVEVVGTDLGAVTDENGAFFILQVPVGTYTLKFTSVGFKALNVENLVVSADKTTSYDAKMETAVTELDAVTVVVEPPLVEQGKDMSVTTIRGEDIQHLPTRGYDQVVQLQSGVVTFRQSRVNRGRGGREGSPNPEINIRGGRPTSVAYLVDGFSQQDPLSGLSTTSINNNAIEEVSVITGGFPAEYGFVSSGIINTITKSGGESYSGSFEVLTDAVLGNEGFDQTTAAFSLGGPLKLIENSSFYISGEKRYLGDRSPSPIAEDIFSSGPLARDASKRLPNNSSNAWTFQGKLNWKITPSSKLQIGGNGSRDKWQEYRHTQLFNSAHTPRYDDQNYGVHGRFTKNVNEKTYFNLSAAWFRTEREFGDGVFFSELNKYTTDRFAGNSADTTLADSLKNAGVNLFYDPGSTQVPGGYLHRISSYGQFKGDLTTKPHRDHLLKFGFDIQKHVLRRFNHVIESNPATKQDSASRWQDADYYGFTINDAAGTASPQDLGDGLNDAKKPVSVSAYAQDKFNWGGMTVTAGVRYDLFDYQSKQFIDLTDPFSRGASASAIDPEDLKDAKSISRLSPRVGIAFPLDDRTNMYFSYGKFFKRPDLDKLYVGFNFFEYKVNNAGYFFPVGNPNLEPERTTAYEMGLTRQISDFAALDITAFYRDISDLIQVIDQPSSPKKFEVYQNSDFATVKGLELGLRMRRTRSVQMELKYTLSSAKGTGSFANTQRNTAWTSANAPLQASPLDFDQRHSFIGSIDIRKFNDGRSSLLRNAGVSAVLKYSSGTPFTKSIVFNEVSLASVSPRAEVPVNSVYGPATFVIDAKADKTFDLGDFKLNAYVWVQNVLDTRNATFVYESSGSPDNTGWLNTASGRTYVQNNSNPESGYGGFNGEQLYNLRSNDPTNYSNPRVILFGLNLFF